MLDENYRVERFVTQSELLSSGIELEFVRAWPEFMEYRDSQGQIYKEYYQVHRNGELVIQMPARTASLGEMLTEFNSRIDEIVEWAVDDLCEYQTDLDEQKAQTLGRFTKRYNADRAQIVRRLKKTRAMLPQITK